MKPVEFRAWFKEDIKRGEPLKFVHYHDKEEDYHWFAMEKDPDYKYPFCRVFFDDNAIKEQYTGLKDTEGSKIFEGDIVGLPYSEYYSNTHLVMQDPILGVVEYKWSGFRIRRATRGHRIELYWFKEEAWASELLERRFDFDCHIPTDIEEDNLTVIGNIYENPELLDKEN